MIATTNTDDQVTIQLKNRVTLIDIDSPTGIGSAAFSLESGDMPEQVIVRLRLAGLEQLRLTSSQESISASVSSGDSKDIHETIHTAGSEMPILPGHPLWMKIEIISAQQSIPLQGGYFEAHLPKEFLRKAGNSFEIQWIDFYR